MAVISLRVDSNHIGNIRTLDKAPVKQVLPQIVKFVGKNPALDSDGIVRFFSHNPIGDFGEPPYTYILEILPFLYHLFLRAKRDKLI